MQAQFVKNKGKKLMLKFNFLFMGVLKERYDQFIPINFKQFGINIQI